MSRYPVLPLAALASSFGIIALLLNSPLAQPLPPTQPARTDLVRSTDETTIYGILLDDLFAGFRTADLAVIDDSTTAIGSGEFARRPTQPPDKSFSAAAADYIARNQTVDLIEVAHIPVHHRIRSLAADERLMGSTQTLRIGLSRVGFSADHTRAVLYFAFGCGALCAQGDIVWLTRDPIGPWQIAQRQTLWVS
jgi:hypothetical protein